MVLINENDCVTDSKFDFFWSSDDWREARIGVQSGDANFVWLSFRGSGARVFIAVCDFVRALLYSKVDQWPEFLPNWRLSDESCVVSSECPADRPSCGDGVCRATQCLVSSSLYATVDSCRFEGHQVATIVRVVSEIDILSWSLRDFSISSL